MHPVSEKLISWYKKHKRDLPWRNTKDPYKIWLSEIILQQTQVIQGLNYYLKFTENFQSVTDLANAPEDKVMRLWQGLGYYSRARNLHAAAKAVQLNHNGKFPNTYESIKALKGVGDYTAAAVSSFAFGLPYAVVDGNVYRVIARLFDIDTPINSTKGKKDFQTLADELLNEKQPALHNSAMMEFGALCCKPQNPKCEECPIQVHCLAFQNNTIAIRPVKENKIKIKNRYLHYFILNYKNDVYIQKRTAKDIWQNLYEFYLIETSEPTDANVLLKHKTLHSLTSEFKVSSVVEAKKHILSHQHLYATFYELNIKAPLKSKSLLKIKRSELHDFALPQMITKYLATI
jgi:A/G-specific adenine glycosylase